MLTPFLRFPGAPRKTACERFCRDLSLFRRRLLATFFGAERDAMSTADCYDSSDPLATSESMLADVRAGEAGGWWRLAGTYSTVIYDWAKQAGLQDADAGDVLQETMLSVYRKVGDFRHQVRVRSFRGWLWTITRRKIYDVYRAKEKTYTLSVEALALLQQERPVFVAGEGDASQTPSVEFLGFLDELEAVKQEFNPRLWQAFWRTAVEEASTADVAAELGMTPNAVRVAKCRVLERIRAVQQNSRGPIAPSSALPQNSL
jgi:RNA polymerase sigma-70 factor, ECF subfamily